MEEMELFTLKEISELLGVKYRSLISCKNYFSDLVSGTFDGRHDRYPVEFVEFFGKVFDLKQTGYTFELVRQILKQKSYLNHNGSLSEYLKDEARSRVAGGRRTMEDVEGGAKMMNDEEGGGRTMQEDVEGGSMMSEDNGEGRMRSETGGGERMTEDEEGRGVRMSEDYGEGMITQEDEGQPRMIEEHAEKVEPWQQAQLKEQLLSEICQLAQEQLDRSLQEQMEHFSTRLEDLFSEFTSQFNAGITQFYKAVHELQEGVAAIDQRLRKLEKDLGVEISDQAKLTTLDLNELQISRPQLTNSQKPELNVFTHADMEFVRASIKDGKPDKEAVIQWIQAEKAQEPNISYVELTDRLNRAGIPTLRGLEGWNRGVVRNLAVRGNGNGDSE